MNPNKLSIAIAWILISPFLFEVSLWAAEIKLKDKSIIKGEIQQEKIKVKTKYGEMDIPVENFVSIIGQLIELKDGTTLRGNFGEKVLSVQTDYGELQVETKDIDFITFAKEEKPPVKEPLPPSEEKIPIPEFHGVYLVTNGELIELKQRFPHPFIECLTTLSGIDISDPNAYIVFYREYPPTVYSQLVLVELHHEIRPDVDASMLAWWPKYEDEVTLKTAPLEGKMGAYKLVPAASLSPGVHCLIMRRGFLQPPEMFDFTVNWEKIRPKLGKSEFEKHYQAGVDWMLGENNYGEAIEEFKKAIEIQSNIELQLEEGWSAYYFLGMCYYCKGMYDEAITELRKAVQPKYKSPPVTHYDLALSLGLSYYSKGMYDEAIKEYKKAIEIHPDWASAHYYLGLCYYQKRMYTEAIAEVNTSLELLKTTERYADPPRKSVEELLRKLEGALAVPRPAKSDKNGDATKNGDVIIFSRFEARQPMRPRQI